MVDFDELQKEVLDAANVSSHERVYALGKLVNSLIKSGISDREALRCIATAYAIGVKNEKERN